MLNSIRTPTLGKILDPRPGQQIKFLSLLIQTNIKIWIAESKCSSYEDDVDLIPIITRQTKYIQTKYEKLARKVKSAFRGQCQEGLDPRSCEEDYIAMFLTWKLNDYTFK